MARPEICTEVVTVTIAGSDGSATGSATSGVLIGFLLDISLDHVTNAAATTDTTVAHVSPAFNILVATDTATDARYVPRDTVQTTAGATTDPDGYDRIPLSGKVTVSVAQANAGSLVATIRYLRL